MVMSMVHAMVSGCTPASNIFSNTVSALKGAFLSLNKMLKYTLGQRSETCFHRIIGENFFLFLFFFNSMRQRVRKGKRE